MPAAKSSDRVRQRLESTIRVQEQRIESLEGALRDQLQESIEALSGKARLLFLRSSPGTHEGLQTWRRELTEAVMEIAAPKSGEQMNDSWYNGERAFCPLCGGSAAAIMRPNHTGFAYPEGLRMHLQGAGNAKQCPVMVNAVRLAKDRLGLPNWWA